MDQGGAHAGSRRLAGRVTPPPVDRSRSTLHHWVGNNFQTISSLLGLQARRAPDAPTRREFEKSQYRVHAMAMVHTLLGRSATPGAVPMATYVTRLADFLAQVHRIAPRITLVTRADERDGRAVEADAALSYALILNELLMNAFEHAFPKGRAGRVVVTWRATPTRRTLRVQDTGIGLPAGLDPATADTLGLWLAHELTQQLGGKLTIARRRGTTVTVTVPRAPKASTN